MAINVTTNLGLQYPNTSGDLIGDYLALQNANSDKLDQLLPASEHYEFFNAGNLQYDLSDTDFESLDPPFGANFTAPTTKMLIEAWISLDADNNGEGINADFKVDPGVHNPSVDGEHFSWEFNPAYPTFDRHYWFREFFNLTVGQTYSIEMMIKAPTGNVTKTIDVDDRGMFISPLP